MRRRSLSIAPLMLVALLAGCRRASTATRPAGESVTHVVLVPLGQVERADLVAARSALVAHFPASKVTIGDPTKLPKSAYYPPRGRYRAERLLAVLDRHPGPAERVVGLTAADISTASRGHADWGVFGLGRTPGRSCVVSAFRLGKGKVDVSVYRRRLGNVVVHEFGHTLGLPHCATPHCLMNDAGGSVKTVDGETGFCAACRTRLRNRSS